MGLIILLCVILYVREYVCWYWKIIQITGELTAIRKLLERMEDQSHQHSGVSSHEYQSKTP